MPDSYHSTFRKQKNKKTLLGVWDLDRCPLTVGGILIFIEELQAKQFIHKADSVEIGIAGKSIGTRGSVLHSNLKDRTSILIDDADEQIIKQLTLLLPIFKDFSPVTIYHLAGSTADLITYFNNIPDNTLIVWTDIHDTSVRDFRSQSTYAIQQFFSRNGFIPYITVKGGSKEWAQQFIEEHVTPSLPVAVHLKNNPNMKNCSNADFNAWNGFFRYCLEHYDVKFMLIGNENVDPRIISLPNIIETKQYGSDLSKDLALINLASIFMGMSSGPCNMAIFSEKPYLIYKNPGHDTEDMISELGDNTRFPFSTPCQRFLRVFETENNLVAGFREIYNKLPDAKRLKQSC